MKIIHLISDLSKVNFGIWNAALNTCSLLKNKFGITSEVWYPPNSDDAVLENYDVIPYILSSEAWAEPLLHIKERNLSIKDTIIHSHGSWMSPSRLAFKFSQLGYIWIYSPHGMLEPWSMKQKRLKKAFYFNLFEKKYAIKSDIIRAVGSPEKANLTKLFPYKKIALIPNGIEVVESNHLTIPIEKSIDNKIKILFMSRLHHKKGIIPLVKAWSKSSLFMDPKYKLIIAGPDDGEKPKMMNMINSFPEDANVKYVGAVYGEEKLKCLRKSAFFILPSHSEGFPTSIVEAMSYGCVPIISEGCNFPEAIAAGLAIQTTPKEEDIVKALEQSKSFSKERIDDLGTKGRKFISENYSLEHIAEMQYEIYKSCLSLP